MERVVAGTYDRFLFGFECSTSGRDEAISHSLKRSFTYAAHKGPVKCVASASPYIASGGADDLIHLYDLKTGADLGFLMSPGNGAVSAVAWHSPDKDHHPSHLFSGAADGGISVWQAGRDWVCYKTLYSHKKEISSVAIHNSGRLALSSARDDSLKLWNLVKGKCVHTFKLGSSADQVQFCPDGSQYAVLVDQEVRIHSSDSGESPLLDFKHPRRALCTAYLTEETLATGGEDGIVRIWDKRTPSKPAMVVEKAHKSRVKGIAPLAMQSSSGECGQMIATGSSDGKVKLWDLRRIDDASQNGAKPMAEADTSARILCLTSVDLSRDLKPSKEPKPAKATDAKQEQKQQAMQTTKGKRLERLDAASKRLVSKREDTKKVSGIAHDGVVDFPEEPEEPKKKDKGESSKSNGPNSQSGNLQMKKRKLKA